MLGGHIRVDEDYKPIGGFDYLIARIVTFVIFNKHTKEEINDGESGNLIYVHVDSLTRLTTIRDRTCDITSRATTKTFQREIEYKGYFLQPHVVGSMGVACNEGIINDLNLSNTDKLKILIDYCLEKSVKISAKSTGTGLNAAINVLSEYNTLNNKSVVVEDIFVLCETNDGCAQSYLTSER